MLPLIAERRGVGQYAMKPLLTVILGAGSTINTGISGTMGMPSTAEFTVDLAADARFVRPVTRALAALFVSRTAVSTGAGSATSVNSARLAALRRHHASRSIFKSLCGQSAERIGKCVARD